MGVEGEGGWEGWGGGGRVRERGGGQRTHGDSVFNQQPADD